MHGIDVDDFEVLTHYSDPLRRIRTAVIFWSRASSPLFYSDVIFLSLAAGLVLLRVVLWWRLTWGGKQKFHLVSLPENATHGGRVGALSLDDLAVNLKGWTNDL